MQKSTVILYSVQSLSSVWLFVAPWAVACEAPLSMDFSRQEYLEWVAVSYSRGSSWSRDRIQLSCVSCIAGGFFITAPPGEAVAISK